MPLDTMAILDGEERGTMQTQTAKILLVDDEPAIPQLLSRWLTAEGYECTTADNGEAALKLMHATAFDLVISDIMMPGMSGMDLLMFMRPLFADTAVIMATAVNDRQTAILALELGAYGYVAKPFDRNEIVINVVNALERRRLTLLSRNYEKSLEAEVILRTQEVAQREEEILFRLLSATGFRDDETGAHVRRIGLYAAEMAKDLGWSPERAEPIRLAAPMHDVGKIGIPDAILRKPGRLTMAEFEIMKRHTTIGAAILEDSNAPMIQLARDIARSHHERWDGSGYPEGLVGDEIPEAAAIVAVVDVYDALVNDRVYRAALPEEQAITLISGSGGDHFGPHILECFLDLLPSIQRIREEVTDSTTELAGLGESTTGSYSNGH
jgi:putative two-component system response regulator